MKSSAFPAANATYKIERSTLRLSPNITKHKIPLIKPAVQQMYWTNIPIAKFINSNYFSNFPDSKRYSANWTSNNTPRVNWTLLESSHAPIALYSEKQFLKQGEAEYSHW